MNYYLNKRYNYIFLLFLIVAIIAIYFRVFTSEYLYTDEANQLWLNKKGINYQTSVPQGRYLTYKIFEWVFNGINTINKVIYARLFALAGWVLSLPIWFFIINRVAAKNKISKALVLLLMIYIITMPPFIIYIGWSACMEMFIGCTCALIAGYTLYVTIEFKRNTIILSLFQMVLCMAFGLIALFTYQNCYGCFFIPFLLHFISVKKITQTILIGLAAAIVTYGIYYLIYKYSLHFYSLPISDRGALAINPINKLFFLFTRPLATAFHFTYIFNEKSIVGLIVYLIFSLTWLVNFLLLKKDKLLSNKMEYLIGLFIFLVLIYLPSLIVKENFSSNRTLFALDIFVFIIFFDGIFSFIKKEMHTYIFAGFIGFLFLVNAWYNYNLQFLDPIKMEYSLLNKIISARYKTTIKTINFICPTEEAFKNRYGITSSWDEFGIPATAKIWVPEPLIKQLIFEKTGNRQIAEGVVVNSWINKETFDQSGKGLLNQSLLIDMQLELSKK